jgi:hypothetical protein
MGVDLFNRFGEGLNYNWTGWGLLTRLAERYGWIPMGTEYPPFEEAYNTREDYDEGRRAWSGGYYSNDTQIVTADDARALAHALERALLDVPDEEPSEKSNAGTAAESPEETDVQCCAGATNKAWVQEFIEFARCGSFQIG